MRKNGKRILSFILMAVMIFALLQVVCTPMSVKAAPKQHKEHTESQSHDEWTKISSEEELRAFFANKGGKGYLTKTITLNSRVALANIYEFDLCLNGYGIIQEASDFPVMHVSAGTLNLYDIEGNSGFLTHKENVDGVGLVLSAKATLNMYGGKITRNNGCGISIENGTVNMYGGEISFNTATLGGGVCIRDNLGTFNMVDGIISNNEATKYQGGGIYVDRGTVNISGGEITKNYSNEGGGGIMCFDGNLTITGGKITSNEAGKFGGGVDVLDGKLYMSGGIISGNISKIRGNGIDISIEDSKDASFKGGYIYDSINDRGKNINPYTLNFNANGGTGDMPTQYLPKNIEMPIGKNTFINSGKVFVEWNTKTDGSGTSYSDESKISIGEDITLYAQWVEPNVTSYEVTFKVENGTWDGVSTEDKVIKVSRNKDEIKLLRVGADKFPEVGSYPYSCYKAGSWDKPANMVISQDTVFTYTYKFDSKVLTITFDQNDGSGKQTTYKTKDNRKLDSLPKPTRKGYDFLGWYDSVTGGNKITTDTMFASDTTVYARWEAHSYTVKFNANGGSGSMNNQARVYDSTEPLTGNTFTYDGYTYMGWNTASDGSGDNYSDKAVVNLTDAKDAEITLYAQWDPNSYKVTLNECGGTINNGNITGYTCGTGATLPTAADMTLTGYIFAGWYDNAEYKGTAVTEISTTDFGNKEYFASWTPITYTVKFDANGGSGSMDDETRTYDTISPLTENTFTYDGYTYMGWNTASDGSGDNYSDKAVVNLTDAKDAEITLYAQWDPNSYKVTLNECGGTINNGNITGYTCGTGATLPTAADMTLTGYIFAGWYDNAEYKGTAVTEISTTDFGNKEYFASWTPITYTVKFDANGGSGTMTDMNRTYADGATLTANVYSYESHTFTGWNTASDGTGTTYADGYDGDLASDEGAIVTLYALWDDVVYTVNAINDGNGTASASADTGIKDAIITVSATPNDGYQFAGWEVVTGGVTLDDATAVTTTFKVGTENVVVKATFEEIPKGSGTTTPTDPTNPTDPTDSTDPTEPQDPTAPETPSTPDPEAPEEPEPEIPAKDWLDDLRLALSIADELGGPQTVEYNGDFALSYDIMEYLKEHTDITLVYSVTYEGVTYTVTIPAGRAIADANINWYGPLWLLANYGGDNVPEIIAGSGKYTVVAGDTLSAIAEKFGTTVDYLAQKNGIKNPDYIIVGQVIVY